MTLRLLNTRKELLALLKDYENLYIESSLESGDKSLFFSYNKNLNFYDEIKEENYIRTETDEFVIKAKDINGDTTNFTCYLNLEDLEGNPFDRFESVEQPINNALNLAIVGTGWTVKENNLKKKRTVRVTDKNSYEIIQEIRKTYRVELVFNTLKKQIEVYERLGEDKGTYFMDSLNLISLQVQSDTTKYATRIIPIGKNGLTIESINNGKNYVENYQYTNKVKTLIWKDDRYTIKENLMDDAQAKLNEISKPYKAYKATIINLAKANSNYKPILEYNLGDVINLISKKNRIKEKQRIIKIIEYPEDHTKDTVEIANTTLRFEDIQHEFFETTDTVNNITSDNGTLNSDAIEDNSIKTTKIEDFEANVIKVAKLKAILAEIENLHVNKADIQNLNAIIAKIGTLEATKASITELNAIHATIQQLKAGKADITDLEAAVAKVGVLENRTAVIENALNKNLTAENIATGAITAGSGIIANGAIGDAEINSVSGNKLRFGTIDTGLVTVAGPNGRLKILGNKLQIFDDVNNRLFERIMLGVENNRATLTLRGADGQTILLTEEGLTKAGITDGFGKADDNSLSALKLDKNSIIRQVNGATETIAGTRIQVGDRTLDVELSSQKNTITEHSKELSSQKATIQALDNAIKLKVDTQIFTQSTTTINNNINKAKEDAINTAKSNTVNAINDIKIGIENLIDNGDLSFDMYKFQYADGVVNYDGEKCLYQTVNTNNESFIATSKYDFSNLAGKKITISFFGANTNNVSSVECFVLITKKGSNKDWDYCPNRRFNLTEKLQCFEWTLELPTDSEKCYIRFDNNGSTDGSNATLYITKIKVVEGTIKSAWSPSANDFKKYSDDVAKAKADLAQANAIANADGKITEEERKRIQQAQENLNTAISKADKAKQDAITEANRVAELKKNEAINSANSHADSKANEALNNAKAYTNTEITTVNTHLNKATSEINILKGQIESKVSQSDIDKSIQNINFNDVNMILNSGEFKDTDHWGCTNGSNNLTVENGILKFKFTNYANWGCYVTNDSLRNKPLDPTKKYTVVCKLKASRKQTLEFYICDGNANNYVYSKDLSLSEEWQIFKFTFNPASRGNERQFRFITSNLGYDFDLYIDFVKMVEGATSSDSWNMAPDYILDNIKIVTDKISTVESKVTQENNSIKASVKDLNSKTESITSNISNINRDLSNKINTNLDAARSFATEIAIAKANLAQANAIASADGKITEEERKRIKQAQDNLNTAITKATEAETKAKSYADVKKQEAINSANNNTNNAINNIKIGGRNYGLNTDVMQQEPYNIVFSNDLVFERGKTYTISMDFDLENLVKGSQDRVGCEGSILFKDGTRQYIGLWHWISQGTTFKGRKSYTFTIENKDIKDNMTSIHIYTELVSSGKRNLGKFKIEEGNKASDYTIAPEDLKKYSDDVAKAKADLAQANAIANTDGKITEEERKRIQQAQENLNTAIARADKAKQDAINAASTDATNKANSALNNAKTYVNAEINTVNSKVHNVESNLNILSDRINTKVSQSDIDKSIQEIKIGGRNLIVNSDTLQNLFSPLSGYVGTREVINDEYALCKKDVVFKCTHAGTGFHLPLFAKNPNRIGKTYTWSFWAKCSVNKSGTIGHESNGQTQVNFTTEWKKFSHTWLFGDCTYSSFTFYIGWNVGEVLYIRDFKIEEGNKATDWTPAPEDVNALVVDSIKKVDSKISDVSSTLTQTKNSIEASINSINSKTQSIETNLNGKATKQEVTDVNNKVSTIKANLDSITQRVSTTESKTHTLENTLNGKANKQDVTNVSNRVASIETNVNGITQRVSNTESRVNTLNGQVQNATTKQEFTQFKQTSEKFQYDIQSSYGSLNLMTNGAFKAKLTDYEYWGSNLNYQEGFGCRVTSQKTGSYVVFGVNTPKFDLKANTTYTLSFLVGSYYNVAKLNYIYLMYTQSGNIRLPVSVSWDPSTTKQHRVHFSFSTNQDYHQVRLLLAYEGQVSNTGYGFTLNELMLTEGNVPKIYSDKTGEVCGNTMIVDGEKLKCQFTSGAYNQMGERGNMWYAPGMEYPYRALSYHEAVSINTDGSNNYIYRDIQLPARFDYVEPQFIDITASLKGWYKYTGKVFNLENITVSTGKVYRANGHTYAQIACRGCIRHADTFGVEGLQVVATLHVTA